MSSHIPYGRQTIDDDDVAAVIAALKSDWLTGGPEVTAFEEAFSKKVGAPYAVASSSGTSGLHIAALALGIGPKDTVVVPALTFLASANAFRFEGANILFADTDDTTGLMTPETLQRCIADRGRGEKIAAIVAVHLGGRCCDMAAISRIAATHGAAVVEDASHALGSRYYADGGDHPTGACDHSDITVFSLHPVKTATMGEGGVSTTRNSRLDSAMRLARSHGINRDPTAFEQASLAFAADGQPNPWYYEAHTIAPNYRASDIHCALGRSQLRKLDAFASRRRELAARYDEALAPLAPALRTVGPVAGCVPVLHLYVVHIDFAAIGCDRGAFMRALSSDGIGTQVHYMPLHMHPYYRRMNPGLHLPGARSYYESTLSIPLFPAMTNSEQDRVIDALTNLVRKGTQAGSLL